MRVSTLAAAAIWIASFSVALSLPLYGVVGHSAAQDVEESVDTETVFRQAFELHQDKKYDEAIKLFEQTADDERFRAMALYNIACGRTLQGRTDEALKVLKQAVEAGFRDLEQLGQDSDLDALRKLPEFQTIAKSIERPQATPPAWDGVEDRLKAEEKSGFSGAVLLVRDGSRVLCEGYGFADRDAEIRNTPETIFAIGSTPIDFTKAGILLLAERGKLALPDPITKYFSDVPDDKKSITIEHLMTGASGLSDFHDVPSDRDPDHGWIDRDEAVRRILDQKLLFTPGTKKAHSHSAWGLLAAVIEIASGQGYPEFTREHLFHPAGMNDTGFFGEPYPKERMAIGTGSRSDGEINAPPFWGKTSWLVMGSGGQVSTLVDMERWLAALREGKVLSPESLERYFSPPGSVLAGGDAYGFEITYTEGPGSFLIVMSNDNGRERQAPNRRLVSDLVGLVRGAGAAPYTLGVALAIDDSGVRLDSVADGGPAAKAGLLAGDVVQAVNGIPLGDEPMQVLRPALATGKPLRLTVLRNGKPLDVEVTPA